MSHPEEILEDLLKINLFFEISDETYINGSLKEFMGYSDIDDPDINTKFSEHKFITKVNGVFTIYSYYDDCGFLEYKMHQEAKCVLLKGSLSEYIESDLDSSKKLVHLINMRSQMEAVLNKIIEYEFNYCGHKNKLLTIRDLNFVFSSKKKISEYGRNQIIHKIISIQKEVITDIAYYLDKFLEVFKVTGFPKYKGNKNVKIKITKQNNSFKIEERNYNGSENLKNFKLDLEDKEFIEKIPYDDFKLIFTGEIPINKINWIGEKNELFYLIKTLYKEQIIEPHKSFWITTSNCFTWKSQPISSDEISRCHIPKDIKIKNRLVSTLSYLK